MLNEVEQFCQREVDISRYHGDGTQTADAGACLKISIIFGDQSYAVSANFNNNPTNAAMSIAAFEAP
jgi:hypothetical protein